MQGNSDIQVQASHTQVAFGDFVLRLENTASFIHAQDSCTSRVPFFMHLTRVAPPRPLPGDGDLAMTVVTTTSVLYQLLLLNAYFYLSSDSTRVT